jgi:hypothetical protein
VSVSAAAVREPAMPLLLRFFDVALVVVAAPIMLLIGVPAVGYLAGAGAWIALRAIGVAADRMATSTPEAARQITIRMSFMLSRLFLLALAVILARQASRNDGLTALVVIVVAFTLSMATLAANRPRTR